MRSVPILLTLGLTLGFAPSMHAQPVEDSILTLTDDKLALEELLPSDRRVYVVRLTGKWNKPPAAGATHYVNFYLPNGRHYAHAVNAADEAAFYRGEVRAMLYSHELKCGNADPRGEIKVAVSFLKPAYSLDSKDLISKPIALNWPMYRPIIREGALPVEAVPPPEPGS